MRHISKKSSLLLSLVVLGAAVVAGLELTNTTHWFHEATTADRRSGINYGPATAAEKQDSESHKNGAPSTDSTATNTTNTNTSTSTGATTSRKTATVEITTLPRQADGYVSLNGFVSNIVENGGTCTLIAKAKSDGKIVKASRPAEANADNTTCGEVSIAVASMHKGVWQLNLSYNSSTASGVSDPLEFEVK